MMERSIMEPILFSIYCMKQLLKRLYWNQLNLMEIPWTFPDGKLRRFHFSSSFFEKSIFSSFTTLSFPEICIYRKFTCCEIKICLVENRCHVKVIYDLISWKWRGTQKLLHSLFTHFNFSFIIELIFAYRIILNWM